MKRLWNSRNLLAFLFSILLCSPYFFSDTLIFNYMDMYFYLKKVLHMKNGDFELFATATRSNLFPCAMYVWMKLFGFSIYALKCFFLFVLVLLTYQSWIVGALLFNNYVGVLASVLVSTSYSFVHFVYFPHIDIFLLFSINICLILMIKALLLPDADFLIALISGVAIGGSYLVKESSIWLLFFFPVFTVLSRTNLPVLLRLWAGQLLPFVLVAGAVIVFSGKHFMARYLGQLGKLVNYISGTPGAELMLASNSGWKAQGLDHLHPFVKIVLFSFMPIFWQWNSSFPIPAMQIFIEQAMLMIGSLVFLCFSKNSKFAKQIIITVILVFLLRYLYVAVAGSKIRQVLPLIFILYFPLSCIFSNVFKNLSNTVSIAFNIHNSRYILIFFAIFLYSVRIIINLNGIDFTINNAGYEYIREVPKIFK